MHFIMYDSFFTITRSARTLMFLHFGPDDEKCRIYETGVEYIAQPEVCSVLSSSNMGRHGNIGQKLVLWIKPLS